VDLQAAAGALGEALGEALGGRLGEDRLARHQVDGRGRAVEVGEEGLDVQDQDASLSIPCSAISWQSMQ
jgi:hypothetical protein